jgi:hypothetical protein
MFSLIFAAAGGRRDGNFPVGRHTGARGGWCLAPLQQANATLSSREGELKTLVFYLFRSSSLETIYQKAVCAALSRPTGYRLCSYPGGATPRQPFRGRGGCCRGVVTGLTLSSVDGDRFRRTANIPGVRHHQLDQEGAAFIGHKSRFGGCGVGQRCRAPVWPRC